MGISSRSRNFHALSSKNVIEKRCNVKTPSLTADIGMPHWYPSDEANVDNWCGQHAQHPGHQELRLKMERRNALGTLTERLFSCDKLAYQRCWMTMRNMASALSISALRSKRFEGSQYLICPILEETLEKSCHGNPQLTSQDQANFCLLPLECQKEAWYCANEERMLFVVKSQIPYVEGWCTAAILSFAVSSSFTSPSFLSLHSEALQLEKQHYAMFVWRDQSCASGRAP